MVTHGVDAAVLPSACVLHAGRPAVVVVDVGAAPTRGVILRAVAGCTTHDARR